jgi:hypothetical protein
MMSLGQARVVNHDKLSGLGRREKHFPFRLSNSVLLWLTLAFVASNLTLAALRSDVTSARYELSQASALLRELEEENRALTLTLRELQDPRRLAEIARARGFGPPEHIVELW